jgi:chromate transport protein ChrA
MAEIFASGRLIDLILGLVLIEAIALTLLYRLTGKGVAIRDWVGLLLAGVFLLLALRVALTDAGWIWIGLWLGLAFIAHLADLAMRWRS